mgnify:CR=1 FL=1|tara:strand:+ start:102 stop:506 length:405 start_codon:yes stop_codon:yes gene_type:complete
MKTVIKSIVVMSMLALVFTSCKKEDGEGELKISFKSGATYTSEDKALLAGTVVTIGVEAETEKAKDPIIRFNISESVDGAAASTVYTENLETTDYQHDYTFTLDSISGTQHKFTFTVTNRDGFNAQKSLTVSVQ